MSTTTQQKKISELDNLNNDELNNYDLMILSKYDNQQDIYKSYKITTDTLKNFTNKEISEKFQLSVDELSGQINDLKEVDAELSGQINDLINDLRENNVELSGQTSIQINDLKEVDAELSGQINDLKEVNKTFVKTINGLGITDNSDGNVNIDSLLQPFATQNDIISFTTKTYVDGLVEKLRTDLENLVKTTLNNIEIGTIVAFAGNGTLPKNTLLCNGQAVSRTTYKDLFSVIGTTYGNGDGSTTFNIPNIVDKFIEGSSTSKGTAVAAGLPNISGSLKNVNPWRDGWKVDGAFTKKNTSTVSYTGGGSTEPYLIDVDFNASKSNSIYGNSKTVQPPAIKMRYVIVCK